MNRSFLLTMIISPVKSRIVKNRSPRSAQQVFSRMFAIKGGFSYLKNVVVFKRRLMFLSQTRSLCIFIKSTLQQQRRCWQPLPASHYLCGGRGQQAGYCYLSKLEGWGGSGPAVVPLSRNTDLIRTYETCVTSLAVWHNGCPIYKHPNMPGIVGIVLCIPKMRQRKGVDTD